MKVLIFGASGSGTTTLGQAIEENTDFVHLDVDNYYWKKTEPPYQVKIPLAIRNNNLKNDLRKHQNTIVSGSMVSWGNEWKAAFDLAVFIFLKASTRMNRLKFREIERYGEQLLTDKKMQQASNDFLEWASQYDDPNFEGRSLKIHNEWIESLNIKVLRIDGDMSLNKKNKTVIDEIKKYRSSEKANFT